MRARLSWPALAALLLAAGCVYETKLQPSPASPLTPAGDAVAEVQGVRLLADGDAWRGTPSHLENVVTPVEVRLENQSGRPLRIKYEDFVLVGSSRFQYAALSPFELKDEGQAVGGSGTAGSPVHMSVGVGVGVAPWPGWGWGPPGSYVSGWGSWGPGFTHPFAYDPWFYPYGYGPYWGPYPYGYWGGYWIPPEPLPTKDMLKRALPEGTLDPGGTLTGFLYFQNVGVREEHVTLQARLVDARTGEQFGSLSIPFDVHG